jgi:hypothetical protein
MFLGCNLNLLVTVVRIIIIIVIYFQFIIRIQSIHCRHGLPVTWSNNWYEFHFCQLDFSSSNFIDFFSYFQIFNEYFCNFYLTFNIVF